MKRRQLPYGVQDYLPDECYNKYRIEEAVNILSDADNNMPLKALASELGFNNLTTFYNSFQKELGIPPSQYRKKLLELKR